MTRQLAEQPPVPGPEAPADGARIKLWVPISSLRAAEQTDGNPREEEETQASRAVAGKRRAHTHTHTPHRLATEVPPELLHSPPFRHPH